MNGNRKSKSLRLVRFGEIFYDQQKRLILICRTCQRHYLCLDTFQSHLNKCIGIRHIVTSINELHYDEAKRETRLINGKQELHIYEPSAVRHVNSVKCNIDWEAELEDPRWYTEESRPLPNNNKAHQSPTNAKENVAKSRPRHPTADVEKAKRSDSESPESSAKRMRHSTPKTPRTILTNQQQHKSSGPLQMPPMTANIKNEIYTVENIVEDLRRMDAIRAAEAARATAAAAAAATTEGAAPVATSCPTAVENPSQSTTQATSPSKGGDTQEILNKLRACGVEVKRRNTRENTVESPTRGVDPKKQLAMDIMRKLQSNGIKCTKVNNSKK
ncbi:uncharacterized protein LOC6580312 [Drosophila mojavensis]|uniref:Uncharacterized protein, isoform A n=1 Tax=Drosophila mojavensis TaxID=7230 RepID=B4KP30_DROMO|nr:uncharacterized protein LOC6580312 [Drosophila mojavensis]XP_015019653.1 uncharacterized protein LOC6580312 [Drosophila mojavensis]EDW10096.1 uncharacterized protein Dmoj_GI20884, isoform A [Drosophila mojavensis]KRG05049.1 uncharacterized protein Dmoj_GI20884, isoform B [Drosophila mojavensis]